MKWRSGCQNNVWYDWATGPLGHFAAGLVLCAVTSGCAYAPLRASAHHPAPLPPELAAYYSYPSRPSDITITLIGERASVRESLVRFPLSVPPGFVPTEPTVELEWLESTAPGRRPAILFNPILGGDYPLERGICRFLARRGFHVALIHRKTLKISPSNEADHLERLLRQGVLRIRQVVDWMEANERVDPNRMGSFGISLGGMASVIAAAVEPRLKAHLVALAGGSVPDILMSSRDPLLTKPLARYLSARKMDRQTLYDLLKERTKTDPMRLAPYVDRRQLFLLIALADRTIGTANAMRLYHALGEPQAVFIPAGHYTAYFFLPYIKLVSLRFFRKAL